jgi:hypothetical protein
LESSDRVAGKNINFWSPATVSLGKTSDFLESSPPQADRWEGHNFWSPATVSLGRPQFLESSDRVAGKNINFWSPATVSLGKTSDFLESSPPQADRWEKPLST